MTLCNRIIFIVLGIGFVAAIVYGQSVQGIEERKTYQAVIETNKQADKLIESYTRPWVMPVDGTLAQPYAASGRVVAGHYHNAVDLNAPAGTPVYAVADGTIMFSGRELSYGGLTTINHKGVYALYGHLSPSRWYKKSGKVKQGEIIGYLADTNEGTMIGPFAHLHFSIRLGKHQDYPAAGEARWMAGYVVRHPSRHQWLDPLMFIRKTQLKFITDNDLKGKSSQIH